MFIISGTIFSLSIVSVEFDLKIKKRIPKTHRQKKSWIYKVQVVM